MLTEISVEKNWSMYMCITITGQILKFSTLFIKQVQISSGKWKSL